MNFSNLIEALKNNRSSDNICHCVFKNTNALPEILIMEQNENTEYSTQQSYSSNKRFESMFICFKI